MQKSNRIKVSNSKFYSTLDARDYVPKDSHRFFAEDRPFSTSACVTPACCRSIASQNPHPAITLEADRNHATDHPDECPASPPTRQQ